MNEGLASQEALKGGRALRTPRAAAAAGIIFSVFLITASIDILIATRRAFPRAAETASPG